MITLPLYRLNKPVGIMKAISKNYVPGIFSNSITRNLTLIFLFGLLAAVTIVTAGVILFNQL
jgi:hypothetical protein